MNPMVSAQKIADELGQTPPTNEGWWPAYTAWQAFAVKVLVEGGRDQDSNITRLYGYIDRMPIFGVAYLYDAIAADGATFGREIVMRLSGQVKQQNEELSKEDSGAADTLPFADTDQVRGESDDQLTTA